MKITIEAEQKEIAALVRELQGQQTVVSNIKFDGGSIATCVEDLVSRSEVKLEADKIGIKNGKVRFSDSDIMEIDRRLGEQVAVSARALC